MEKCEKLQRSSRHTQNIMRKTQNQSEALKEKCEKINVVFFIIKITSITLINKY